jgi:tetratricopeptide (TPR) repeat protein
MEKRNEKDSEFIFAKGIGYEILSNKNKAEFYYKEALFYYPASAYYALRFARFYLIQKNYEETKRIIASISAYKEKYRIFKNPNGVFFYLLEDLEAEMEYTQGNHKKAVAIAQNNLKDAEENMFVTSSVKARAFITHDRLIQYLKERLRTYEK